MMELSTHIPLVTKLRINGDVPQLPFVVSLPGLRNYFPLRYFLKHNFKYSYKTAVLTMYLWFYACLYAFFPN